MKKVIIPVAYRHMADGDRGVAKVGHCESRGCEVWFLNSDLAEIFADRVAAEQRAHGERRLANTERRAWEKASRGVIRAGRLAALNGVGYAMAEAMKGMRV